MQQQQHHCGKTPDAKSWHTVNLLSHGQFTADSTQANSGTCSPFGFPVDTGVSTQCTLGGTFSANLRASTENILGIAGFGLAAELSIINMKKNTTHIQKSLVSVIN